MEEEPIVNFPSINVPEDVQSALSDYEIQKAIIGIHNIDYVLGAAGSENLSAETIQRYINERAAHSDLLKGVSQHKLSEIRNKMMVE